MRNVSRGLVLACALMAACAGVVACASTSSAATDEGQGRIVASAAEGPASGEVREGPLDAEGRADVERVFAGMRANAYGSVEFAVETQTMALGREQGRAVSQTVRTSMEGELDLSEDAPRMHLAYEAHSMAQPGTVAYDMYIAEDGTLVEQEGEIFRVDEANVKPQSYVTAITGIASEEEVGNLLDAADKYRIERGDATVVTITADARKAVDAGLVDVSSLPAGASLATLVASYTIGSDGHLSRVRLMSSTSGTPTYRVNQTYSFSRYDEAELPKWPEVVGAQDSRIVTDDEGHRYFVADDGSKYLVETVDADGTVHFAGSQATGGQDVSEWGAYYGGSGGSRASGSGGSHASGGDSTGLGEPQISDTDAEGMGEPVIYDDGE